MNIVFDVSTAANLCPIYQKSTPLELVEYIKQDDDTASCLFLDVFSRYYEYFPKCNYYAIDSSPTAMLSDVIEDLDIINIPTKNIFARMFLFISYIIAFEKDPICFFVPSNCIVEPFEKLSSVLRNVSDANYLDSPFMLFSGSKTEVQGSYIVPDDVVIKEKNLKISTIKNILTYADMQTAKDNNNSTSFLYSNRFFAMNAISLLTHLQDYDENLSNMLFMVIDAWKDGTTISTLIADIITALDDYDINTFFSSMEERLVCEIQAEYNFISSLRDLWNYFPHDENDNYVYGKFNTRNTANSILINHSSNTIDIENISSACVLASDKNVRIFQF